jgi:hypothetical protein
MMKIHTVKGAAEAKRTWPEDRVMCVYDPQQT